jgi:choline-phosphate cytidylyltransferase
MFFFVKKNKNLFNIYMKTIYTDGIFDLFHRGHVEYLKACKNIFKDLGEEEGEIFLIVGIINDKDATGYKRIPIYNENDRYEIIENIKCVNKIIKDAPLIITEDFMEQYKIDYVIHSFSNSNDEGAQDEFFKVPIQMGKFKKIEYYSSISTTDIIKKIKSME